MCLAMVTFTTGGLFASGAAPASAVVASPSATLTRNVTSTGPYVKGSVITSEVVLKNTGNVAVNPFTISSSDPMECVV
jgi:hypothetical protein